MKGQSAIEYMMTYGWAILVVLVVGVCVWQFGFLDLSRNVVPDKRGFSQLSPSDWSLMNNGTFTMVVQNNAGSIVRMDSMKVDIEGGKMCVIKTDLNTKEFQEFRSASAVTVVLSDCLIDGGVGDYYRANVSIGYVNPSSDLSHISYGIVWGGIE